MNNKHEPTIKQAAPPAITCLPLVNIKVDQENLLFLF